jgi:hypothetical protein
VGVPGDRTGSNERRGNEGCSGVHQRLRHHLSGMCHAYSWVFYGPGMRWATRRQKTRT